MVQTIHVKRIDDIRIFVRLIKNRIIEIDKKEEASVFYDWVIYNLRTLIDDNIYRFKT